MIRAVYWTCALLAVARARVFERCELARRLASLGVDRDLSTWMCITYHESRFDTAARNTYSGDHGLFQISELYWCGPNKACGLPCSALRDDDISDDLECALKIREEHDRIQGNGFLAWVVYPQHCKHSTKKYIAGCDIQLKNATVRTASRSRLFIDPSPFLVEQNATSNTFKYNPDIDKLKPPYLTINSIVNDGYTNLLEEKYSQKSAPLSWLNYKIDNIDKLTIPVSQQFKNFPRFTPSTTTAAPTTTTSTTTAYPPIKVWRRIETNQFRKKQVVDKKPTPEKWLELGKPASRVGLAAPSTNVGTTSKSTPEPTTTVAAQPSTTENTPTSTPARTSASTASKFITFILTTPRTTKSNQTTFKPFVFTTTTPKPTSAKHTTISTTAARTTTVRTTTARTTTEKPIFTTVEFKPFVFTTKTPTRTTEKPTTEQTTTRTLTITKKPTTFAFTSRPSIPSTSIPSSTKNWFKKVSFISTSAPKTTQFFQRTSSTSKPISTTAYKPRSTINFFPSITTTARSTLTTTGRPYTGPDPFSRSSRTSRVLSKGNTLTPPSSVQPFVTFTTRPTTTRRSLTRQASHGSAAIHLTTTPKTKPSQSIFDLYLNPTQRPKLPTNRFSKHGDSAFKLTIFSGGTTPAPRNMTRRTPAPLGGAARNHVRRLVI